MDTSWAVNASKVNRALGEITAQAKIDGSKVTEEAVKARYIALGGLIQEVDADIDEDDEKPKVKAKKGKKADIDEDDEDDK